MPEIAATKTLSAPKRTVELDDRKTSISLESAFWAAAKEIASEKRIAVSELVRRIDRQRRPPQNLSSAIRLFVLDHYKSRAAS
jgi:predicted DNA-binding ribbon-helix-helix protein